MSVFEDVDNTYALITEIKRLRNIVKCPICLEILNNPLEISCSHIFCAECISTFMSGAPSKLKCPICRKNIKRQRQRANGHIDQLINFVRTVSEKIRNQFGCDVPALDFPTLSNAINKSREDSKKPAKSPSKKKILHNKPQQTLKEGEIDAFELLMTSSENNLSFRKSKNIRTYSSKKNKQDNNNEELYKKLIEFEDDEYRLNIINWLCDNRNKFDRLSQTQSIIDDDSDVSLDSFDMPSISQEYKLTPYKMKTCSNSKKRTRSLEVKVKRPKFRSRSHSFSGEDPKDLENMDIEEVESDKDVLDKEKMKIIHMLEEKCLSTIESELMLQNKENLNFTKSKEGKKQKGKKNKDTGKKTSTGWTRIREMNKTINKSNRGLKKLHVSLSSSAKLQKKPVLENSSRPEDNIIIEVPKIHPVVVLNRLSSEVELCGEAVPKSKAYDLNDIEKYITDNINKCESLMNKTNSSNKVEEANEVVHKDKLQLIGEEDGKLVTGENEKIAETNSLKKDKRNFTRRAGQKNYKKFQTTLSSSIFSKKEGDEETDDLYSVQTQKINESDIDSVERNLIALFSSPEAAEKDQITCNPDVETEKMDEISRILKELRNTADVLKGTYKNNMNVDIIKLSVTKLSSLLNNFKSKDILSSNKISSSVQTNTSDMRSVAIQTEKYDSSGFKISSTADFKTLVQCNVGVQTDQNFLGTTQTPATHVEPSTVLINSQESIGPVVSIRTDTIEDEDPICIASNSSFSSREPSEILVNNDEIVDYCKDNYEFTESMDNINFDTQAILVRATGTNKSRTQDNKKIATPIRQARLQDDVAKGNLHSQHRAKKKLTFDKAMDRGEFIAVSTSDSDDLEVIENEETVVPVVTDAGISRKSLQAQDQSEIIQNKKTFRNSPVSFSLIEDNNDNTFNESTIKRFKRARAIMEDGMCSEGIIKKMKMRENPYLMPQLSVEFVSQDAENENEDEGPMHEDTPSMQISQSLNYDEYLDRIMQKYDKNEMKTSTPMKPFSTSKQTKSQYITNKCDALIKEAAISSAISPPKKKFCSDHTNEITSDDVIKEFDLPFIELDSDGQESPIKKEDNRSEPMFCSNVDNLRAALSEEMPFSNMKRIAAEFAEELEPASFKSVPKDPKSPFEIKVLQNVLLQQEDGDETPKLQYNLEDEWRKMEEEKGSEKSEEVFSDSDVDVVQTTPQKNESANSVMFISQSLQKRHLPPLQLPPPEDSPDIIFATDVVSYLNRTFEPPTEFKDVGNKNNLLHTDNFDATLVPFSNIELLKDEDLDETLMENVNKTSWNATNVEKRVSQKNCFASPATDTTTIKKPHPVASNKHLDKQINKNTSTLGVSPVRDIRDLNPIERALKSNYSPLEIIPVRSQPKKASAWTNTPKRQESILAFVNNQSKVNQQSNNLIPTQARAKPCIAYTRLGKDQVIAISSLINKKLATYSNSFDSSVTHMIVSVNEKNCIQDHTTKFVSAVAAGIWVLGFKWIQECLSQNKIVPEEPYEALDVSGMAGPKMARLTKLKHPLLQGFRIHCTEPFHSITKKDLENIVQLLGGQVVHTLAALKERSGIRLIITETKGTQDFDIYETWLEALKVVTVDIEWLSRSVGQYQLLSLRPFALCSDDIIEDLGYPKELLVDTPFSFSQSIYAP